MKDKNTSKIKSFIIEAGKILGTLLLCAAFGFFLALGSRASDPKRIAKDYFACYITNNYEKMYDMIDVEESEFINLDNFKSKCEGEKIYGSVHDYTLSKPVKQKDTVTYVATYKLGDSDVNHTYTITLNKKSKRTHLFFHTWKISVKRFMIDDFRVKAPAGTKVQLDGIDLSKYKKSTSEDGSLQTYKIKKIFSGDHTVSVNLDAVGQITKTQYITKNDKTVTVTTNDFAMRPDVQKKLYEYSAFVVNSMYQYSMDVTKNFDDIKILYSPSDEAQASAKATFDAISSGVVRSDGAYIKQLEIKDINPQISAFHYPDNVTVTVNFNYNYTALTAMTTLSGIVSEYSGEGNDSVQVYFGIVDGDWKIVKVDMNCIDYTQH